MPLTRLPDNDSAVGAGDVAFRKDGDAYMSGAVLELASLWKGSLGDCKGVFGAGAGCGVPIYSRIASGVAERGPRGVFEW